MHEIIRNNGNSFRQRFSALARFPVEVFEDVHSSRPETKNPREDSSLNQ